MRPAPREPEEPAAARLEAEATLDLDLPAAHGATRTARHLVRSFARAGGVVGRELDNLLLVASELLSNAVDHGSDGAGARPRGRSGPRMRLSLAVVRGAWRLEVTDQGSGDPEALRALLSAEEPPDLEDERGRGLFLIARMVDEVSVGRNPDGPGIRLRVRRGASV
jgi:anti-sigma regulatory factor (Ser/Thr protein kinase)